MRNEKKYYVMLFLFLYMNSVSSVFGWNDEVTHKDFTEIAIQKSTLSSNKGDYLSLIGFEDGVLETLQWEGNVCDDETKKTACNVIEWLTNGAEKEDERKYNLIFNASVRCFNHFHDPIGNKGLSDDITGQSALEWAQDANSQFGEVEGDQSWSMVRTLFSQGLTGATETERNADLAAMFKGLGHQMHLVQDMGVPYHVRNDAHAEDSLFHWYNMGNRNIRYFEYWVKKKQDIVNPIADSPKLPTLNYDKLYSKGTAPVPVSQLWDADKYTEGKIPTADSAQGLSEYTNGNFFSHDTIFTADRYSPGHKHYFPYPKMSSTNLSEYLSGNMLPEEIISEDGEIDSLLHLKKVNHGEKIDNFVSVGYFSKYEKDDWLPEDVFTRTFYLDEQCHRAYAEKLVPRAVGYSAALLNYFFRGKMELMPEVSDQGDFLGYVIENKTEEEGMEGTFEIYYDNVDCERIKIWSGDLSLGPKDSDTSKSALFEFDHPEPAVAQEPGKYLIVFNGTLGMEEGAVAGAISVLEENEYVYFAIGERCFIWDIARNDYASITDSADDEVDFPCETSKINEWFNKHPAVYMSTVAWDDSSFIGIPIDFQVGAGGPNCEMNTDSKTVCGPTPGLPDKEDCVYRSSSYERCNIQGPYQHCSSGDPDLDFVTWFTVDTYTDNWHNESYQAHRADGSTIFGSYVGRFGSHEGMIRDVFDVQRHSILDEHEMWSYDCKNFTGEIERDHESQLYFSHKIVTFLGDLGEILIERSNTQTRSITHDSIMGPDNLVEKNRTSEGADGNTNSYRRGIVSDKSVIFVFLFQYRIKRSEQKDPDPSSISTSYQSPILLVLAAAKGYNDTSAINPFDIGRNSSFTNAIRVLVADYYNANGAQGDEFLPFEDQIHVSIRSQLIEGD